MRCGLLHRCRRSEAYTSRAEFTHSARIQVTESLRGRRVFEALGGELEFALLLRPQGTYVVPLKELAV